MRFWLFSSFLIVSAIGSLAGLAQQSAPNPDGDEQSNALDPLVDLLLEISEPGVQLDVLKGIRDAVKGQRDLPRPAKWTQAYRQLAKSPNLEVRRLSQSLALTFGDPEAMQALRKVVTDEKAPLTDREWGITSLAQARDPKLLPILQKLILNAPLREAAFQALAAYDSPKTPGLILERYSQLSPTERQTALYTLVSRPTYAEALLAAVEQGLVPARDLSTYLVRQIAAFENKPLNAKLRKVWGEFRPTSADKTRQIQTLKSQLTDESLKKANAAEGRVVFSKTCAGCHVLFDEGRLVGPNLTGSQRNNLDYILENVFDPSAVVGRDYRLTTIATNDGRVLTGVVAEEAAESLTLKTPKEDVLLAKSEIEARRQSPVSMMPEGLFEKLSEIEIRNLIAYLGSTNQVALPTASQE